MTRRHRHRRRPQRPGRGAAARAAASLARRSSISGRRSAAPRSRPRSRRASARRRSVTRSGRSRRDVMRALQLDRARPRVRHAGSGADDARRGRHDRSSFHRDPVLTAASIDQLSPRDAGALARASCTRRSASRGVIARAQSPGAAVDRRHRDARLVALLGDSAGARARSAGAISRGSMRWMPMSVADLDGEWFETDLLQAAIAAHAIFGNFAGPRSAGTGAHAAAAARRRPDAGRQRRHGAGRPGALAQALAAIATNARRDDPAPARASRASASRDGRAYRRRARQRRGDRRARDRRGHRSAAGADLDSSTPSTLPPTFLERIRHIRARGVTAKINLALPARRSFTALARRRRAAARPLAHRAGRRLPRARVRRREVRRDLAAAVARDRDAERARSVARAGRPARDVDLRALRAAASARPDWDDRTRDARIARCMRVLEPHARGLESQVVARRDPDAGGSGTRLGRVRRTHLSRRADARSVVDRAAAARMGAATARRSRACSSRAPARIRAAG